jgi:predicted SAM-dependent methyltransferase
MKLNVGDKDFNGLYLEAEWINIDIQARKKECPHNNFITMSVLEMPEGWSNRFEETHMVHCLEHINRNSRQRILEELYRVTIPGGSVYIEVPDFVYTVHLLNTAFEVGNDEMAHKWTTSIYGKQRFPGDQHCWGYTRKTLADLFTNAGFNPLQVGTAFGTKSYGDLAPMSSHCLQEPVLMVRGFK